MTMDYVTGIEFKYLVSGPAQIGRMLNYVYLTGHDELRYKPANRKDDLTDNIGSEWGIALMIGQNILCFSEDDDKKIGTKLELTKFGKLLYDHLIKIGFEYKIEYNKLTSAKQLNEVCGISYEDINYIRNIFNCCFVRSILYKDLCIYFNVSNRNENYIIKNFAEFKENFYKSIYSFYKNGENKTDSKTAQTSDNQMASLKQLMVFLKYFIEIKDEILIDLDLFRSPYTNIHVIKETNDEKKEINMKKVNLYENRKKGGYNKIYYGAPGCGKSKYVQDYKLKNVKTDRIVRTVFHPEYQNSDFVGQILPSIDDNKVTYTFKEGPFTSALIKAFEANSDEYVYLVIEELNRGNASAIFGDLFQLLDRDENGMSEYFINNNTIIDYLRKYFASKEIDIGSDFRIYLPSNLVIFATMNSSDQNVFTLDTAFKRRWLFEQIDNKFSSDDLKYFKGLYVPGTAISWPLFVKCINTRIMKIKYDTSISEDKRIGKFFVNKEYLSSTPYDNDSDKRKKFAYKVLEYLWNDVCRTEKDGLFIINDNIQTLEDLISDFEKRDDALTIFNNIKFE